MTRRRVVITGLGVVAPNGIGKDAFWANLIAGRSAVGPVSTFDASRYPSRVAAEVRNFVVTDFIRSGHARAMGRFAQFAVAAARLAANDAGLSDNQCSTAGVCIGTAVHGIGDLGVPAHSDFLSRGWSAIRPSVGLEVTAHAATAHVQQQLRSKGPMLTIASACCTGIDAIAWGADQIRRGTLDVAFVGAAEAPVSEFVFGLFLAGGFLSTWTGSPEKASRPYDLLRSGLVLAEGAAVLVLESLDHASARGASIYAEIRGYASASEANSNAPEDRYVDALRTAILNALAASQLAVHDLDYVCAHGNGTKFDDRAEARAHHAAFGRHAYRMPVSSIKSMIGQPFAASGALQAAATALAIRHSVVPPTINYEVPDPACDLDYVPNMARAARIRHALVHSHSLGGAVAGSHSALVLSAPPN
ncbi:MAG TPA: beta-ketoacyl-[acyl-carrier-protein] synthase family protein [Gemmatimonadales bacterium]|nr:beta-ketoacyl-[acyl-carrier-protein] synthase family protein [Gemmatimonadales bacterium]